jgi:hypothetical protein
MIIFVFFALLLMLIWRGFRKDSIGSSAESEVLEDNVVTPGSTLVEDDDDEDEEEEEEEDEDAEEEDGTPLSSFLAGLITRPNWTYGGNYTAASTTPVTSTGTTTGSTTSGGTGSTGTGTGNVGTGGTTPGSSASTPGTTTKPVEAVVELSKKNPSTGLAFDVSNMLPGDKYEKTYVIDVTHSESVELHYNAEIAGGDDILGEVLWCEVVLSTGETLYSNYLSKMPESLKYAVKTDSKTTSEITYTISTYIPTEISDSKYQGKSVVVDFTWWLETV